MKKTITKSLTALLLLIYQLAAAQADLQNNGILYISNASDILYINGGLTNASGAALTNNGNLYVRQALVNGEVSMAAGTGTLFLNGASAQTVSGAQLFRTFNMVTGNAAGITLNNNLSVSGAHTFTAGIISTSATPNYLIYEAGSSYNGDGDAQHVNGWVQKIGATAFTFPLGNGTVERTIATSNLSASSVFNARYEGATTNTANVAAPLVLIDPNEYWIVNRVSGGDAQVDMNWDNSKIAMPNYVLSDIRVANYISGNWTQVGGSATGNVTTTGNISSGTLSSFGAFTFGSLSFLLPLKLIQFTAHLKNGNTILNWSTTDEVNVSHYEVERSDDGISFYRTGNNTAARNTSGIQDYSLTDSKPLKDIAYYRLRSVDADGKTKLSKVVMVKNRSLTGNYFTIVNPAQRNIVISTGTGQSGGYEYQLMTIGGQKIQTGRMQISDASAYQLPLSASVVRGIYVLELRKKDFSFQQRILVQ